jgi:formate hydrogenlyase subunit 4
MSVLYPLIQALVLLPLRRCCPALPAWRARVCTIAAVRAFCRSTATFQTAGPPERCACDASWVFRLTPFVMVGVMLTIATALPVVTVGSPLPGWAI